MIARYAKGFISNISVLLGIVAGGILAVALGKMTFDKVAKAAWFEPGSPFAFGMPIFGPVLMAPISIAMAQALGVSPYPLAMTVALAASAAFITPVSSPVNMLVVGPGNYRFGDFVKIGIPLTLIVLVVTVLLVPVVLPF